MKLLRRFERCRDFANGAVVTIGNFDGVHLGHRALLALVVAESRKLGLPACVMSFEPMPSEFFGAKNAPGRLSTWRERYQQIKLAGVDILYLVPFSTETANLSPEQFVQDYLVKKLQVDVLYVGDDFRFGKNRTGDYQYLETVSSSLGFEVKKMSSLQIGPQRVSSSAVREALLAGDLAGAEKLLGRRYSMSGIVVQGARLGRTLGYPTANIHPRRNSLPMSGIFAVRVFGAHPAGPINGVANLGFRPTVGGGEALLEAHLFDFDGDLYGKRLNVEFIARLRDEVHFSSVDLMVEQMHRDTDEARRLLGEIVHG